MNISVDQIKQLRDKAKSDWKVLETKGDQQVKEVENKAKVDDLKSLLLKKDNKNPPEDDGLSKAA